EHQQHHLHESPPAITVPLIILAILALCGGWIGIPEVMMHGGHRLEHFLEPVFADSNNYLLKNGLQKKPLDHTTEWLLMAVSVVVSLVAIFIALNKFGRYRKTEAGESGIGKVLQHKWYVDELYGAIITRPLSRLSVF